jgi:hypothetical protein
MADDGFRRLNTGTLDSIDALPVVNRFKGITVGVVEEESRGPAEAGIHGCIKILA